MDNSTRPGEITVASHNIMHGRFLSDLVQLYRSVLRHLRIDVLCLQENEGGAGTDHARVVAESMGPTYGVARDPHEGSVATVYNRALLSLERCSLVRLPQLTSLRWFERLYLRDGLNEQKYALITSFRTRTGNPMHTVNFHLEAGGGNVHRRRQMDTIAAFLHEHDMTHNLSACGDSNCFTLRARHHRSMLDYILHPLRSLNAFDDGRYPTHFFARQREGRLLTLLWMLMHKLRLDFPRCYDVICTNLTVSQRGQIATLYSDHDLVWARIYI